MLIVFGAINQEYIFKTNALPEAGETLLAHDYDVYSGGKGANQALAAARMGTKTALISCVGNDGAGIRMMSHLKRDGVMVTGVSESENHLTGTASIITSSTGQKYTVVALGANVDAHQDQIPDEILKVGNVILMQMELSLAENEKLINRAYEKGVKIILNLAPAMKISDQALKKLDYLIVNQIEARQMAAALGLDVEKTPETLARALSKAGELNCIVTMGDKGSTAATVSGQIYKVKAMQLEKVIDTTGAGDAYCGTFAACIHNGETLLSAMKHASIAGTLACKEYGSQDSFAYSGDIKEHLSFLED